MISKFMDLCAKVLPTTLNVPDRSIWNLGVSNYFHTILQWSNLKHRRQLLPNQLPLRPWNRQKGRMDHPHQLLPAREVNQHYMFNIHLGQVQWRKSYRVARVASTTAS